MDIMMKQIIFLFLGLVFFFLNTAYAIETSATHAIVMSHDTGIVLFEHNPDTPMSPASMSKLMTILLVLEEIKAERILPNDTFIVSDDAWKRGGAKSGGSTMFLQVQSEVSIKDLLRGVIIQSGNDASIVLAEGIAGSEEEFAVMMTERGLELGMRNSHFVNATGLPHPDHKTTARDLALLAQYLINHFPEYYTLFAERQFTWNSISQPNRNPLIYANIAADGLKTGYTSESGYGLVGSAIQNDNRLIIVINGLPTKRMRSTEGRRLLNWGFRTFMRANLVQPDTVLLQIPVWQGKRSTIDVVSEKIFSAMIPKRTKKDMVVTATYNSPLFAPVKEGTRVGKLYVKIPNIKTQEVNLVVASSNEREGIFGRIFSSLGYLLFGD